MRYRTENCVFVWLLFACLMFLTDVSAQAQRVRRASLPPTVGASAVQRDTAARQPANRFEEVARRVDSLQFIIVYNAELLRKDLDTKLIWIYVMLGVMIVASMIIYGALSAAQRQRRELEERVYGQVSSAVSHLENQIKGLETGIKPTKPPAKSAVRRAKRSR